MALHPFIKMAGLKNEAEFYSKFKSPDEFFQAHPEARHMQRGGSPQSQQQSGQGQEQQQMQQLMLHIVQELKQGVKPQQIIKELVKMGIPLKDSQRIIQQVVGELQQQSQGQSQQQVQGQPGQEQQAEQPQEAMQQGGSQQQVQQPQQGQQNPQQEQMKQLMLHIIQELKQGVKPQQIIKELVKMGIPLKDSQRIIQQVVGELQQQSQGQSQQQVQGQPGQEQQAGQEEQPQDTMQFGGSNTFNEEELQKFGIPSGTSAYLFADGGGFCAECGDKEMKEGGKWIQKATAHMRTDHPCTGSKFGSKTCPPGSKRYILAKTFRAMHKKAEGGESKGNTNEGYLPKRRDDFLSYLKDNTMLHIGDEEAENVYKQMGGESGYQQNPFIGMAQQSIDQSKEQGNQDLINFFGATQNVGMSANPYWQMQKAEDGKAVAGLTKEDVAKIIEDSWTKHSQTQGQPWYNQQQGYGYVPMNHSPYIQWKGKSDMSGFGFDPKNTHLTDFDIENRKGLGRFLFGNEPRKIHMHFQTYTDPVTGEKKQVPATNNTQNPGLPTPTTGPFGYTLDEFKPGYGQKQLGPVDYKSEDFMGMNDADSRNSIKQLYRQNIPINTLNKDNYINNISGEGSSEDNISNINKKQYPTEEPNQYKPIGNRPPLRNGVPIPIQGDPRFQYPAGVPDPVWLKKCKGGKMKYGQAGTSMDEPQYKPIGNRPTETWIKEQGDLNYMKPRGVDENGMPRVTSQDPGIDITGKFKQGFDPQAMMEWGMAGTNALASFFEGADRRKLEDKQNSMYGADQNFVVNPGGNKGFYGQTGAYNGVFNPSNMTPVQFQGQPGSFEEGGEYWLDDDQVDQILKAGGKVQYL